MNIRCLSGSLVHGHSRFVLSGRRFRTLAPRQYPSLGMSSSTKSGLSQDVQDVRGASFTMALVQLGAIGPDKTKNLIHAQEKISEAVNVTGNTARPDLVVLPEVFNSPYGSQYFDRYAEVIGWMERDELPGQWDIESCQSESIRMLSRAAQEEKIWLIGGQNSVP